MPTWPLLTILSDPSLTSTTDAMINEIRLRAKLPEDDDTWSDARLLLVINSELDNWAAPFLIAERGEFLITYVDHTTESNVSDYPVPARAVGGVLRNVSAIDTGGNTWPMNQVDIQELSPFTVSSGTPTVFYMMGDSLVLTAPPTNGQWRIRMWYARRPSQVVLSSACAQITGVVGNVITCAGGFPGTFTNGTSMDFVHGGSSFLPYSGTYTMPTPVSTSATFASVPSRLAVGDWLCLKDQAPFAQIPADMQPTLTQRMVALVLRSEGDDKAGVEWRAFQEMEKNMRNLEAPRVQGNMKGLRGTLNRRGGGGYFGGRF